VNDERRHGHRLTTIDVGDMRAPPLDTRRRIDRHGVTVQEIVIQRPIRIGRSAIHDIAARLALRGLGVLRPEFPPQRRARLRQIERIGYVRIGRDYVHR
jgi:hypothetical protein